MKQDIDSMIEQLGLVAAGQEYLVASALFTYRCSISCRHCLFGSAPDRPDVVMSARQCADALSLLHDTNRVIHIAGGEAMLYWDVLSDAVALANREGNAPHFVETNCSFATDDAIVRERLGFLADHGVMGILASADAYHQEFVPAERFLRVRRIAKEIFGKDRFWGPGSSDLEVEDLEAITGDEHRLRGYVRNGQLAMVGTAHRQLSCYLDDYAPQHPDLPVGGWHGPRDADHCRRQFLADLLWELHIDPYGNIQTNCGIILGNVTDTTPAAVLANGPETANRFVEAVCERGALGLAELAQREDGFVIPKRVTQTCELCYLTRLFLRQSHPDVFGPAEVYT